MAAPRLTVIGDHDPAMRSHAALDEVLAQLPHGITASWLATDAIDDPATQFAETVGLWIAPGSPYRSFEGALRAIRYAREHNLPLFGT
jgi:CTP synthase (UTP-ammonia lyase)